MPATGDRAAWLLRAGVNLWELHKVLLRIYMTIDSEEYLKKSVKQLFEENCNKLFVKNRGFRKPIEGCGVPHIKFGIYRPGNTIRPNNLSIVDFDKIQIKEIKMKDGKD